MNTNQPNDGGPAFPCPTGDGSLEPDHGMSLRDYFAAHAPPAPEWFRPAYVPECPTGAPWAYFYADCMIAARTTKSEAKPLDFDDAIKIAKGCFDYRGGHRDEARETFHHGIQTVVNALEGAKAKGLADYQVKVLHQIGSK